MGSNGSGRERGEEGQRGEGRCRRRWPEPARSAAFGGGAKGRGGAAMSARKNNREQKRFGKKMNRREKERNIKLNQDACSIEIKREVGSTCIGLEVK